MDPNTLSALLTRHRYTFANERELQDGIEQVLRTAGVSYVREARLSGAGRVDFVVGRIALEVKIAPSFARLARQLSHYARHPDVDALVVASMQGAHQDLPATLAGKPVHVAWLLRCAL